MFSKSSFPSVTISQEMIEEARKLIPQTKVNRTVVSEIDTLTGHIGEFVFAQYYYGDWKNHRIGQNKGDADFPDIEIKSSSFPLNPKLHLLVREDYAQKRKPSFYVLVVIDVHDTKARDIAPGTMAYLCGFATGDDVDNAPLKDFGGKLGNIAGYRCHHISILKLTPMNYFKAEYEKKFIG
jgi:hypothetical protein